MYSDLKDILKSAMEKYPVLSKKDERAMIKEYSKDPQKMRELLILHNLALIPYMAKRMNISLNIYDEFKSNFTRSMVKLANKFDPKKNVKFSTFVLANVYKDVCYGRRNYLDEDNIHKSGLIYLDKQIGNDPEEDACTMYNMIDKYVVKDESDEERVYERTNTHMLRNRLMSLFRDSLNGSLILDSKKEMFVKFYFAGKSMKDLAEEYGCSRNNINIAIKHILTKMRLYVMNSTKYVDLIEYMQDPLLFGKDFVNRKKIEAERKKRSNYIERLNARNTFVNNPRYFYEEDEKLDLYSYSTYCDSYQSVYGDTIGMGYDDYLDRLRMRDKMMFDRSSTYHEVMEDIQKHGIPNWKKYGKKIVERKNKPSKRRVVA